MKTEILIKDEPTSFWDRIGVLVSGLCVLHCILTPLVLGYLTASGLGFLGREIFHQLLAISLVFVAIFAFAPAFRHHRRWSILAAGALGLAFLILAGFVPHGLLPEYAEGGMTIAGSLILVGAHIQNRQYRRCADGC